MICEVGAAATRPLRQRVLRPHQALEELVYPGDDDPGTWHGAVVLAGEVVAVATISAEGHPTDPRPGDRRLRGVATDPRLQGRGLGAKLLQAGVADAQAKGAPRLWCNARLAARRFYERAGWVAEGEVFDVAGIGPHVVMTYSPGTP